MAMTSPFRLDDEVALVTGGGTGLGLAIARCMAASGARVVITGRREDVLKRAAEDLGPAADYVVHDVTQSGQAVPLVTAVEQRHGPVTVLVNNAGINLKRPAVETTEEEFLEILRTNVLGAHSLVRAAAPGMTERGRGSILFIASMASLFGIPGVVAYSAAKSGLLGMVRTLATELSPVGVRVNAIAPGWIETAMSRRAMEGDPERERKILGRTPMARFGTPEDIGWAAVYLSSDAARFLTGVTLPVDGGASIGF
ncbi:MAG: SDR family oxidoreductase [Armatimonadetes bacterium]|nr:SDR family oxidoreductase [Armatimonadota bacterium]